ncbi:hypothetical protein [Botryobacter ruber]|uniref:hypothetical protein n=1 Tax=Botryobacter ruber TaxID=2171629 RepID=UPI000E0BE04D|nr:hypothetical protein [Botryobacter ruber]
MTNKILTYLYDYYGDGNFHDIRPVLNQYHDSVSEVDVDDLRLEGLIETKSESVLDHALEPAEKTPLLARITEKGVFILNGDPKITSIIDAINNQNLLHFTYVDAEGRTEDAMVAPYIYGRDPDDRLVVWGAIPGKHHEHRRFLINNMELAAPPQETFNVVKDMMLSQPRDIEVIAQVQY